MTKEMAEKYLQDMIADGWVFKPIFGDKEYVKSSRDGYVIHIDTRKNASNNFDSVISRISIWDEKDIWVEPSYPKYDFEQIRKNNLKCDYCGEYADKVYRVGFANKACKNCVDDARKVIEVDGWNS
jgi:hypothetical protein